MVRIIADTLTCMSPEEAKTLGVDYIPQIIVFGEQTYRDDYEMNAREFLKRLVASPILPKTAAPPPALYMPIFQTVAENCDTALVIAPSAQVSGTYRSAVVAAQDFPNADIRVIDTQLIASGMGAVVKQAIKWAKQGLDADTISARVQEMASRHRVYFLVDTLEYLQKGGRIGTAKALLGSLLQMKPILHFTEGHIAPFESQRTHKRALARLKEIVLSDCPRDPEAHLSIMHGGAEELARQTAAELSMLLDIPVEDIPIYDLTPAILVHAGPGVLGISYFVQAAE